MSKKIVVNSTPIIALAKCKQLSLLKALFDEIIIPTAVYDEICAKDDIASEALKAADWIKIRKTEQDKDRTMYQLS